MVRMVLRLRPMMTGAVGPSETAGSRPRAAELAADVTESEADQDSQRDD